MATRNTSHISFTTSKRRLVQANFSGGDLMGYGSIVLSLISSHERFYSELL